MSSSGTFSQLTFPDILREILSDRASGRLRVNTQPHRKTLYFESGRLVYATSTQPDQSLGEVLVASGRIDSRQLRRALEATPSFRQLGKTLVELGYLTPPLLVQGLRDQVRSITLSIFCLSSGSYLFEERDLSGADIHRLPFRTEQIVREGAMAMSDPHLILRVLGSLDTLVKVLPEAASPPYEFDRHEASLLELIRRAPLSVRDICNRSDFPAIDTCRALVSLLAVGVAQRQTAAN